jgi:hypothetical protein
MSTLSTTITPEQRDHLRHTLRATLSKQFIGERAKRLTQGQHDEPFLKTREVDTLVAELLGFHNANAMFAATPVTSDDRTHRFLYTHNYGTDIMQVITTKAHQLTRYEAVLAMGIDFEPERNESLVFDSSVDGAVDPDAARANPEHTALVVVNFNHSASQAVFDDYIEFKMGKHYISECVDFINTLIESICDDDSFEQSRTGLLGSAELANLLTVSPETFSCTTDIYQQLLGALDIKGADPDWATKSGVQFLTEQGIALLWSPAEQLMVSIDTQTGCYLSAAFFDTHQTHPVKQKMRKLISDEMGELVFRRD